MSTLDWIVVVAGAAAIGWVNWYFLWRAPRGGGAHEHDHG
jgi:hypothetical protein